MNIRFSNKVTEALKKYVEGKGNKSLRLKVMSRG